MGQRKRQPQPRGRSKAHGMLKVEEARAMPQRLQLRSNRPHDGDDQAILQLIGDASQALEALHHGRYASSHMTSRVRSSALACAMLYARAFSSPPRFSTLTFLPRTDYGI